MHTGDFRPEYPSKAFRGHFSARTATALSWRATTPTRRGPSGWGAGEPAPPGNGPGGVCGLDVCQCSIWMRRDAALASWSGMVTVRMPLSYDAAMSSSLTPSGSRMWRS